ncbi:MAG: ABC transporter ATP-binding protein, partial [Geminicoccaceae bacterium]|nr:ABC transporter ATP-binding protein [Geminicoccaceae bacterium]
PHRRQPDDAELITDPLVEVQGLAKYFDVSKPFLNRVFEGAPRRILRAVDGVDIKIPRGETFSLVGESGCGKSTVARTIVGLYRPSRGTVMFEGTDLATLTRRSARMPFHRRVQMIFQDPFASLNPRKTVGSAIAEPMLVHGVCDREEAEIRVTRLLEQVGLDASHALRFPHEFSGGQRQRICIARALGLSPRLIVADESVSALDVSIKAQVINLMLDLQRELGLAYLFISHDIAVVERVSHRVAVMYLGEIVEIGPREAIFERPAHPYTKKLMSAVPVPDPARRGIRREISNDEVPSPVRTLDYQPPARPMIEVGPGHFIQQFE